MTTIVRDDVMCRCVGSLGPNPECGACGGSGCITADVPAPPGLTRAARRIAAATAREEGLHGLAPQIERGDRDDHWGVKAAIRALLSPCQGLEEDGRRPDGPGLSHSVSSPSVSTAAAASIPGAIADVDAESVLRNAWCDFGGNNMPADFWTAFSTAVNYTLNIVVTCARDEQPKAENPKGLSPQGAGPVGKAEAPASLVQPPSSQESGVGETTSGDEQTERFIAECDAVEWEEANRQWRALRLNTAMAAYIKAPKSPTHLLVQAILDAADAVRAPAAPRPSQREG